MSAELEHTLLVLHAATNPGELGRRQLEEYLRVSPDFGGATPADALRVAAAACSGEAAKDDRFAAAQAFALGVKHQRAGHDVGAPLETLAVALLRSGGVDTDVKPAANGGTTVPSPARQLVDTVSDLTPGGRITRAHVEGMNASFGRHTDIRPANPQTLSIQGPGASLATLLLELFTNDLSCRSRPAMLDVNGTPKEVMLVEVDACTNQPFDRCTHGIDPRSWPDCNPYFLGVQVLSTDAKRADGWSGTVKERVGCPFNGHVYETDLAVTMIEQPSLCAVAFELAPKRNDDGLVSVDRGFMSVTDEGLHRRVRVLKVYRIEHLDLPETFLCPIWASQVVMSPWWCDHD